MKPQSDVSKPEWLTNLERQSFEVELIVSGLAIYGSIALGSFLHESLESLVFQFNDNVLFLLKFVFLYLFVAQKILLLGFIIHFSMRVLWIGMIGLNSVYPKGINTESQVYPEHLMDKIKSEYPDITYYNLKLDKTCSIIFSILCSAIIIFIVISIWLFIAIGISEILRTFLSDQLVYGIQVILFVIFYILIIGVGLLTTAGPFKKSKLSQKYGYRLLSGINRGLLLMFHEPFAYISYTLRTNSSTRQFILASLIIAVISVVISRDDVSKTMNIYTQKAFFEQNSIESNVFDANYGDTHTDGQILYPMIQSEIIDEGYIKLFIPEYARERKHREILCGAFRSDSELSDSANRAAKQEYYEECARNYYTLIIDIGRLENVDFERRRHNKYQQWGYQTIIPIRSLADGKHVLKIKMEYKNADDESAMRIIPFYKLSKE